MNSVSQELENWKADGDYLNVSTKHKVFYRQWGDVNASAQDTLLLLHGFPESSFSFHKVINGLLMDFKRIIVFDMLGYGLSDKPREGYSYLLITKADVALELYKQLDVRGGHILSHDMGTSVLTELLFRQVSGTLPDFFDQGFQSATFTNGSMVLKFAKLRVMQRLLLSPFGILIGRLFNYSSFKRSVNSAHSKDLTGLLSDRDIESLWVNFTHGNGREVSHLTIRYLNDRKRYEQSRWLPALAEASLTIPVHFCWGEADQVARVSMVDYIIKKHCPSAVLSKMENVGHFCQIASPEIWLKNIRNFYQGL